MTVEIEQVDTPVPPEVAEAERQMVAKIQEVIPVLLASGAAIDKWKAACGDAGLHSSRVTVAMKRLEDFFVLVRSGAFPSHDHLMGLIEAFSGDHCEDVLATFSSDENNRFLQFESLLFQLTRAVGAGVGPFAGMAETLAPFLERNSTSVASEA